MMVNSIKILFMIMYFNYTVSDIVNKLNRSLKLSKFKGFSNEIPKPEQSMNT